MLFKVLRYIFMAVLLCTAMQPSFAEDRKSTTDRQYIYTIGNSDTGNAIFGFLVLSNGALQALPGSPYSTGGFGQGHTLLVSSDNGLVISEDKRFLFAPNRGSNDIAVFRIRKDGVLTPVWGSPFPTGGITPTSLAVSDNLLFVAHSGLGLFAGCPNCDYRGFSISEEGQLTPLENTTIKLSEDPASGPLAIRFSPDGKFLIGTEIVSGKINVFRVKRKHGSGGPLLESAPGSPFTGNGALPLGFNFNPTNSTQLFISNVGAPPTGGQGSVSAYLMASTGQLAPIEQAVPNEESATCWINLTQDGKWLFATNTNSDTITTYAVAVDGRLTFRNNIPLPRDAGRPANQLVSPVDMSITANDEYLFVLLRDVPALVGYKIGKNGILNMVSNSPINLIDALPFGLASVNLDQADNDDED